MKELEEKISSLINEYFDKKIGNVDWRYDITAEDRANRIVEECIDSVLYEIKCSSEVLDTHIEDFEDMYSGKDMYYEDLDLDNERRTLDLINERR